MYGAGVMISQFHWQQQGLHTAFVRSKDRARMVSESASAVPFLIFLLTHWQSRLLQASLKKSPLRPPFKLSKVSVCMLDATNFFKKVHKLLTQSFMERSARKFGKKFSIEMRKPEVVTFLAITTLMPLYRLIINK